MAGHAHNAPQLTKNQALVLGTLESAGAPLSAYTILDHLRGEGLRAPLQVYRALDKLVAIGMVHRLESLNAFVACRHPGCGHHETVAFMICEACSNVGEITDASLEDRLKLAAEDAGFAPKRSIIELRGTCRDCQS